MAAKAKKADKSVSNWVIKRLSDAFKPRPKREYAVDGLFAFSSLNIVFGAEGSMKSLLLMDMGMCISEGMPWLQYKDQPAYKFQTTKCNVLYIDCDNGSLTDDERINAFALSHGLTADENSPFMYISMPEDFDISDDHTRDNIFLVCKALNIRVVIMDNLGLINSKDENSHEMASVMGNLRRLSDQGICVIVVHHQRKTNGSTGGRLGENLRGHSSIAASLDTSLFISRRDITEEEVMVIPTKSRFAPIEPFGAYFSYEWIDGTKELQTALFYGIDVTNEIGKALMIMVQILQAGEMSKTNLVKEMVKAKVPQKLARETIEKGVLEEIILKRTGAHNTQYLTLNDVKHEEETVKQFQQIIDG